MTSIGKKSPPEQFRYEQGNSPVCRCQMRRSVSRGWRREWRELLNGWTKTFISMADTRSRMMCGRSTKPSNCAGSFPVSTSRAELSSGKWITSQPAKENKVRVRVFYGTWCSNSLLCVRLRSESCWYTREEVAAIVAGNWMRRRRRWGWGRDSSSGFALFVHFQCTGRT